ncbi:hypothetical protein J6T21_03035 [Candidatus Saccharibacteria bacterium]|nr:hypothetical protein [Candidatus Saccharibacteria bacterium]
MPINRLECENQKPHWTFAIKVRYPSIPKIVSVLPVARITVDGEWLDDPPRVNESVFHASYYRPYAEEIAVPSNVLEEIANITRDYSSILREAYESNRLRGFV